MYNNQELMTFILILIALSIVIPILLEKHNNNKKQTLIAAASIALPKHVNSTAFPRGSFIHEDLMPPNRNPHNISVTLKNYDENRVDLIMPPDVEDSFLGHRPISEMPNDCESIADFRCQVPSLDNVQGFINYDSGIGSYDQRTNNEPYSSHNLECRANELCNPAIPESSSLFDVCHSGVTEESMSSMCPAF